MSGLTSILGALNPEIGAEQAGMQLAQKHGGALIMAILIVLGIIIMVISAFAMAVSKAPHSTGYVFLAIGALLTVGGGVAAFMLERKN